MLTRLLRPRPRLFGTLRARPFGTKPPLRSKLSNDLGGPGGQEAFPASTPLRRHYATTTGLGIAAACVAMAVAKLMQVTARPDTVYVLVHDDAKGELDDVRRVPVKVNRGAAGGGGT